MVVQRLKLAREVTTFVVGIAGIVWQTVIEHTDRPLLLALFATMIGVPAYLATSPRRKKETSDADDGH